MRTRRLIILFIIVDLIIVNILLGVLAKQRLQRAAQSSSVIQDYRLTY